MLCATCKRVPIDFFFGGDDKSNGLSMRRPYYDHPLSLNAVHTSAQKGCELCLLVKNALHRSVAAMTDEDDSWSTCSNANGESLSSLENDRVIRIRTTNLDAGKALDIVAMRGGLVWRGSILFDTLGSL